MRVVLHAHSTWSYDGSWTLDQIARFYGRFGVRAVMMTEHDTRFDPATFDAYRAACGAASTPACRIIPGIEYSSPDNDIHMLTWGLDHFLVEHRPVLETLEKVQAAGGVAIFAHPIRRAAWAQFDPAWVPFLSGIELWNRKSDGISIGRDALKLISDTGLPATVGQDFHILRHAYPLTMKFDIASAEESLLVDAIRGNAMRPQAFRRDLLGSDGAPRVAVHDQLESLRRAVRDLRNRLRSRS